MDRFSAVRGHELLDSAMDSFMAWAGRRDTAEGVGLDHLPRGLRCMSEDGAPGHLALGASGGLRSGHTQNGL